ncbi:hypothetical protein GCM10007978_12490 [Shewanella hanedai]|uniref:Uncharacterized protein n=1 Tax=Shewanella hanedai TaxID=25 RepID=A0A553JQM3_SHEHA|nr:ThiF family adenylyltransferase [Shewanella hanedai]TRY14757.1 hypothetical protein FN961_08675 [Shewanella hanedai]GGI76415.1 hypothetical protein GCM10007978_12490 [Shewanella hanedai]
MREAKLSALNALDRLLRQRFNAFRLVEQMAEQWLLDLPFEEIDRGWIIPTNIEMFGEKLNILVVVPVNCIFPYKKPWIYVKPEIPQSEFPHIEADSKMCVWSDQVLFDSRDICYVESLVIDAHKLLESTLTGELNEDFNNGFLSYWNSHVKTPSLVSSLCSETGGCRLIYVAYLNGTTIFADSKDELSSWIEKVDSNSKNISISNSFLLVLDKPWIPSQYPEKLNEIVSLLSTQLGDLLKAKELIGSMIAGDSNNPKFLIKVNTNNGPCFVSMQLAANCLQRGNGNYPSRKIVNLGNGFRDRKVTANVLCSRAMNQTLKGLNVDRIDQSWILGRGHNKLLPQICRNRVAIIGVGSLGSELVPLIIKAGVSNLCLIDIDRLEPANLGRHWLTYAYLGENKAKGCQLAVSSYFPWVNVESISCANWIYEDSVLEHLKSCDLIINTTGEWGVDVALMELSVKEVIECPILFGFTEPHAVATHAYLCGIGKHDYLSLYDNCGQFKGTVAEFPTQTKLDLPLCGGSFQPYGAIELSFGQSVIADLAINCLLGNLDFEKDHYMVWVGSESLLFHNNGQWNSSWSQYSQIGTGSRLIYA